MNNVIVRSISGIVYIALIVGCIFAGDIFFFILTSLFSVTGMYEFTRMAHIGEAEGMPYARATAADVLFSALIPLLAFTPDPALMYVTAMMTYFLVRAILGLNDTRDHAFREVAKSVTGIVYVSSPLLVLNLLYASGEGMHVLVLLMFVMIWLNDTGAFCVGSLMGRHRLFERLSPKKSWEGFFGGLFFCIVAGYLCTAWLHLPVFRTGAWIAYGVVVCVFATLGDLFESLIKRTHKIKDSGNLIPGHGGILDRIDSLLFVGPATLGYLILCRLF